MAKADYYQDDNRWGEYQYITLKEIVNNYMMSRDKDDSTALTPRYKVLYQAKRGIRELYYDVVRDIRSQDMDLGPNQTIILPHDYVNYVRISWVDRDGYLHPFAENTKMSIARLYLQDNNYNLLFDIDGDILEGDRVPHGDTLKIKTDVYRCTSTYTPNKDRSTVYNNGEFVIDKEAGVIRFGSSAKDKSIVLEYLTDGLYDSDNIRINKFAEQALHSYIYYNLIKNKSPKVMAMNEKIRARKEWFNDRRIAKRRVNSLNKVNLLQAMKGSSRFIKEPK